MNKTLLVEDDLSLIDGLSYSLKKQDFETDIARTVKEADDLWYDGKYDLIILDVSLPDGSGFDVCKKVRQVSNVPIIFLTASDEEVSIIMGLDMGGDDYITKPFKLGVLVSRINALLRRTKDFSTIDAEITSNGITVFLLQGQAHKGNWRFKLYNMLKKGNRTMEFNIHNVNRQNELSLIKILLNRKRTGKNEMAKNTNPLKRDTVVVSSEAQALSKTQKVKTTSSNTKIDQSIDLHAYMENAKKANQNAIAMAGDEINANNSKAYTSEYDVCKSALTEKYSHLVKEAKTHSNPELYIQQKYYDSSSSWYASDLSDEERNIAYKYEMEILRTGKIGHVAMGDSLFRGVTLNVDSMIAAKTEFDRQMVDSQINNILKKNGIELAGGQELSFTVAPYTYEIAVGGVDDETKRKIEKALNVGTNGKNLYDHIRKSATCEGITSTQITEEGILKNRLFYSASNMLGLDIRNLSERNGTYYTDSGEDIVALYNKNVDESNRIPNDFKAAEKESFAKLVRQISSRGWNNMADMILSINYNGSELIDKYQNHGFGSTSREWLEGMLKASTYCVML